MRIDTKAIKVITNKRMDICLQNRSMHTAELSDALTVLLSGGFTLHQGCYFLKRLLALQKHVSAVDFYDKTAFECFVNSIHIDDYAASSFFEQAILFADALKDQWKKNYSINAEIILSETDYGYNVKIHALRPGEEWINIAELDSFEEAVLVYHI